MTDLVMAASAHGIAHARARSDKDVSPDDLLLGALEAVSRLGVAILGPLTLDLRPLRAADGNGAAATPEEKPRYAPATATVFDQAAAIARVDGEPRVRLVHVLAAFEFDESELLGRLGEQHGFDEGAWRAALAAWDAGSQAAGPRRPEDRTVLSVDGAAATLSVHAQTIRGYIRSGKLPAYRIAGERALRIFASDLYDLLEPVAPDAETAGD